MAETGQGEDGRDHVGDVKGFVAAIVTTRHGGDQ